eukprot:scaffold18123_cov100-Isochrysis_galbana.AAC.1
MRACGEEGISVSFDTPCHTRGGLPRGARRAAARGDPGVRFPSLPTTPPCPPEPPDPSLPPRDVSGRGIA